MKNQKKKTILASTYAIDHTILYINCTCANYNVIKFDYSIVGKCDWWVVIALGLLDSNPQ